MENTLRKVCDNAKKSLKNGKFRCEPYGTFTVWLVDSNAPSCVVGHKVEGVDISSISVFLYSVFFCERLPVLVDFCRFLSANVSCTAGKDV